MFPYKMREPRCEVLLWIQGIHIGDRGGVLGPPDTAANLLPETQLFPSLLHVCQKMVSCCSAGVFCSLKSKMFVPYPSKEAKKSLVSFHL